MLHENILQELKKQSLSWWISRFVKHLLTCYTRASRYKIMFYTAPEPLTRYWLQTKMRSYDQDKNKKQQ